MPAANRSRPGESPKFSMVGTALDLFGAGEAVPGEAGDRRW